MIDKSLRTTALSVAAVLMTTAAVSPAAAGGRGHGHDRHGSYGYYGDQWRYDGYRASWRGDYYAGHHRHYRYKRHKGGLSGAEAGLIAAGIVGAAILIDSASERSSRSRYYDDRPVRRYEDYGRYDRTYGERYDGGDFYYRRDDRRLSDRAWEDYRDDEIDRRLDGEAARPGEYNYGAAFNDCKAETREAARREGLTVGLPARPDEIDGLEGGTAVRFVSRFEMQERGGSFRRTMVCEADASGVRFLELV